MDSGKSKTVASRLFYKKTPETYCFKILRYDHSINHITNLKKPYELIWTFLKLQLNLIFIICLLKFGKSVHRTLYSFIQLIYFKFNLKANILIQFIIFLQQKKEFFVY